MRLGTLLALVLAVSIPTYPSCSHGVPTAAAGPITGITLPAASPSTQAPLAVTTGTQAPLTVTTGAQAPLAVTPGAAGGGTAATPRLSVREVLEHVAGPERFLIWGSASSVYLDFLQNWFVSIDRLGYGHKVLFVAEDDAALQFLLPRWPRQTLAGEQLYSGAHFSGAKADGELHFNTFYYNSLVDRRPEYFKALLDLNITVLYNDVDIVWVGDPFPYFKGTFDLWVQEDVLAVKGFESRLAMDAPYVPLRKGIDFWLCTCFMLVRPTPQSKALIGRWSGLLKYRAERSAYPVLNQPAFNKVRLKMGEKVSIGVLPLGRFPSGCLYFGRKEDSKCSESSAEYWRTVNERNILPVVVHNNYAKGHKMKLWRFKKDNLWFLGQERQEPKLPILPFEGNASALPSASR